jgi:tight adherence protein C
MTLLLAYFVFVLTSVFAVVYLCIERGVIRFGVDSGADSSAKALFADAFRAMGEALPAAKEAENPVRRLLLSAGYRNPSALAIFYGIKAALAVFLATALGLAALVNGRDLASTLTVLLCGAGLGFLAPDRVLRPLVRARAGRIRQAVPAALDLMVLSVEAGQSLNLAILETSSELRLAFPDLAAELAQVHLELRAGKSRGDALRRLGERNKEPELRKLANVLIDSDRFGTSLGPALRSHAKYLRSRMKQGAQEQARRVAVKLVFPVFFLIFPSVLLVTLGPAVIKMTTQLKSFVGEI